MSSIAHTQPRTGRRKFNLRAYLAGTAATAALIGAVVLAFASLGAYVAFNGLPVGGSDSEVEASVAVGPAASPAKANVQRTSQNTAPADVRRAQGAQAGGVANGGDGRGASQTTATAADTTTAPTNTGGQPTVVTGGSQETSTPTPPQAGPSDDPPSSQNPTPQVTAPGAVGGTIGTVEQTLQEVGVDVPISGSGSAVQEVTGGLLGGN